MPFDAYIQSPLPRDISLAQAGAPRVSMPSSAANTPTKAKANGFKTIEQNNSLENNTIPTSEGSHPNSGLVKYGNGSRLQLPPMEMNIIAQPVAAPSKGWLASIPLLGRFLTPKVPVQQVL